MNHFLKLTVVLALLYSLQSCAPIGRTVQALGRTVNNAANMR